MTADGRRPKIPREPRRQLNRQPAWLTFDDGLTRNDCFVLDSSPGGARIMTDAPIDLKDTFKLALVPSHPQRQPCEVVWRRGNVFGLKFISEVVEPDVVVSSGEPAV